MANNYCENKSNKPVITKYDPSKNYVVQMVESLASIDYPNENHIYVIESTGEKYIFYNGAFEKFEATALEPLVVTFNATYTASGTNVYQYYYSDYVTYDKTYDEVKQAVEEGRPIYLKPRNSTPTHLMDVEVYDTYIKFSSGSATRFSNNTEFNMWEETFILPKTGTYGTSTRIRIYVHNLAPDDELSSTSTRPVQNKVVKQAIDALNEYVTDLQSVTDKIPFMNITGDTANGISVTEIGITEGAKYALYSWGTQRGITPIISFTYTNGDNEAVTKKLVRINGNAYEYDNHSLTELLDWFEVRVNDNTTIAPNCNKTMNIGAIGDATTSLHLKIVMYDTRYRYDITAINGDVSEGIITPIEGETNFIAIPIDGKYVTLRNIATGNVSFAPEAIVAYWSII